MSEEETREQIEELINNEELVKDGGIIVEEEEVKPKTKTESQILSQTKNKITKESVEAIIEEPVVEEPEQPNKIYESKKIVQCPDCGLSMTQHTLLYIHK